ncbi:hypothetical protein GE09DRAFT_530629 [Coniochaeta sp. 2T2.1]|nr:hypothetical protein GE09DRAFT_530629 [Coniochaeta sp. 2T2.1]
MYIRHSAAATSNGGTLPCLRQPSLRLMILHLEVPLVAQRGTSLFDYRRCHLALLGGLGGFLAIELCMLSSRLLLEDIPSSPPAEALPKGSAFESSGIRYGRLSIPATDLFSTSPVSFTRQDKGDPQLSLDASGSEPSPPGEICREMHLLQCTPTTLPQRQLFFSVVFVA